MGEAGAASTGADGAERLSPVRTGAVLYVAIIGALVPALQPMLLGAMVAAGRLSLGELGRAATLELLGMAVANSVAGVWLKPVRIRGIGILAGAVLLVANLATMGLSGSAVAGARALAGLASGVYLWFLLCMLARSAAPARMTGLYLVLQSASSVGLSAIIGAWILPRYGSAGGFACLGAVSATMVVASFFLPPHFGRLGRAGNVGGRIPAAGIAALAAVWLVMAATLCVWIYLSPLAAQHGHAPAIAATAISAALAMQMLGGGAAMILGDRIPALAAVCLSAIAALLLAGCLVWIGSPLVFVAAASLYGAAWMFGTSYQVPLVIAADPSRRSAMATGGAQLFGYAAGPLLASLVVRPGDVSGALLLGQGLFIAAILLAILAWKTRVPAQG